MPTYDYRCQDCGHEFELIQKMTEAALKQCPRCPGVVKRLIGAGAGLLFKGSGFYITDYRSEGYKRAATADKGTAGSSGTTGSTSSSPAAPSTGGSSGGTSGGGSASGSSSPSASGSTKTGT